MAKKSNKKLTAKEKEALAKKEEQKAKEQDERNRRAEEYQKALSTSAMITSGQTKLQQYYTKYENQAQNLINKYGIGKAARHTKDSNVIAIIKQIQAKTAKPVTTAPIAAEDYSNYVTYESSLNRRFNMFATDSIQHYEVPSVKITPNSEPVYETKKIYVDVANDINCKCTKQPTVTTKDGSVLRRRIVHVPVGEGTTVEEKVEYYYIGKQPKVVDIPASTLIRNFDIIETTPGSAVYSITNSVGNKINMIYNPATECYEYYDIVTKTRSVLTNDSAKSITKTEFDNSADLPQIIYTAGSKRYTAYDKINHEEYNMVYEPSTDSYYYSVIHDDPIYVPYSELTRYNNVTFENDIPTQIAIPHTYKYHYDHVNSTENINVYRYFDKVDHKFHYISDGSKDVWGNVINPFEHGTTSNTITGEYILYKDTGDLYYYYDSTTNTKYYYMIGAGFSNNTEYRTEERVTRDPNTNEPKTIIVRYPIVFEPLGINTLNGAEVTYQDIDKNLYPNAKDVPLSITKPYRYNLTKSEDGSVYTYKNLIDGTTYNINASTLEEYSKYHYNKANDSYTVTIDTGFGKKTYNINTENIGQVYYQVTDPQKQYMDPNVNDITYINGSGKYTYRYEVPVDPYDASKGTTIVEGELIYNEDLNSYTFNGPQKDIVSIPYKDVRKYPVELVNGTGSFEIKVYVDAHQYSADFYKVPLRSKYIETGNYWVYEYTKMVDTEYIVGPKEVIKVPGTGAYTYTKVTTSILGTNTTKTFNLSWDSHNKGWYYEEKVLTKYENKAKTTDETTADITLKKSSDIMAANLFFPVKMDWYGKFNRYGWIDPFDSDRIVKEFLFFTKPDLNIFENAGSPTGLFSDQDHNGKYSLNNFPIFRDAFDNHLNVLISLESSIKVPSVSCCIPFMNILSNAVNSKLDLPGISAESQTATSNIMGVEPQYRGHSLKSDNGYDFTLQFLDTQYLEIYTLAKIYDEYSRLLKLGEIMPKKDHIINKIIDNQFSIYKFLVGSDGETIIYYAKLTGVFITDVPRSEFGDPPENGFKYSLSFHANFVEDMNPSILAEFNKIVYQTCNAGNTRGWYKAGVLDTSKCLDVWNPTIGAINNTWARFPQIEKASKMPTSANASATSRVERRYRKYDYRLKWFA